ncbi:U3 snoRNP protein, partial [Linnemannia schmuckeri]
PAPRQRQTSYNIQEAKLEKVLEKGQALESGHKLGLANIAKCSMAVQFLADRVQISQLFKEQLVETVRESRNSDGVDQTLAANAMTILVRSGMRFNSADLRGIKIRGANLTGGEFDSVDLRDADLTGTILDKCWLRQAGFQGAKLGGAQFGEKPLDLHHMPNVAAYSSDSTLYAVGFTTGAITVFDAITWSTAYSVQDSKKSITALAFSPIGDLLAFGNRTGMLGTWNYTSNALTAFSCSHDDCINDLVYSRGGSRIATAGQEGSVRIWDAITGECIRIIVAHYEGALSVAFSPDGKQLVSGGFDNVLRVWNLDTGALLSSLEGHDGAIFKVLFSPDGRQIATSSSDKTVRTWSASTGTWSLEMTLGGHSDRVTDIAYSSEGQQLASCSEDSTIRTWDSRSGSSGPIFRGHTDHVVSVSYSQNGAHLVSCSRDKALRVWDCRAAVKGAVLFGRTNSMSSGMYPYSTISRDASDNDETIKPTRSRPLAHTFVSESFGTRDTTCFAISPNGFLAASASMTGGTSTIEVWFGTTSERRYALNGHTRKISCIAFSPNSQSIASGDFKGVLRVWNAQSGDVTWHQKEHDGKITSIAYSADGEQIISGGEDGTVRLWDALSGGLMHEFHADGEIECVAFSPSGSWIACGSDDGSVRLWDLNSLSPGPALDGIHTDTVKCIAFSPDGNHIASGGVDNTVRIWNINTETEVHVLKGHNNPVRCLAYSPLGDRITSGSEDCTMKIWNVATGELESTLDHSHGVSTIMYSSEAPQLWTATKDYKVHGWNFALNGLDTATIYTTAFSMNGQQVASSLGGDAVRLWDTDSGKPGPVLHGHSAVIESVSFSPVGDLIATASSDSTVRIWDSVQGACLEMLQGHGGIVTSVVFSPNGTQIATSGWDNTLRWWDFSISESESPLKEGDGALVSRSERSALVPISVVQTDEREFVVQADESMDKPGASMHETREASDGIYIHDDSGLFRSPVYSPDGREILVISGQRGVLRFDTQSKAIRPPLVGHSKMATCIAYSPSGDRIATSSEDGTARIWDPETGSELLSLVGHDGSVTCVAFSPFNYQLATSGVDWSVRLWNVAVNTPNQQVDGQVLSGHGAPVLCIAYSPDGRFLASGSEDRTIRLWDPLTREHLAVVGDFTVAVKAIQWRKSARGGLILVTGCKENMPQVWEVVEGKDHRYEVRRYWAAGVEALAVSGTRLGQEHGLTEAECKLLGQRGAVVIERFTTFKKRNYKLVRERQRLVPKTYKYNDIINTLLPSRLEVNQQQQSNYSASTMSRRHYSYSSDRECTKRLCFDTSSLRLEDQMPSPIELRVLEMKGQVQSPENYIPPLGKETLDTPDSYAFPLLPFVMKFLNDKRQVMLLMGDAGSGKSYFLQQLERELWNKYTGPNDSIPIRINLTDVENDSSDILGKVLKSKGFRTDHIQHLRRNRRHFILICDGYDEAQVQRNIYTRNNFNKPEQWRAKLIIACRSDKLGQDSDGRFQPTPADKYDRTDLDLFEKVAMAPFTRSMVVEYVEKYVTHLPQLEVQSEVPRSSKYSRAWSSQQYMNAFAEIPNLMELVGHPYILFCVLDMLPTITGPSRDDTEPLVSFDALYKRVFEKWMRANRQRLYSRDKTKDEERAFNELLSYDFEAECMKHMKDLAVAMLKNQKNDASVVRYTINDLATWKGRFFGTDARARLLKELVPLTRSGKTYRFIFPSLLDYLYSLVVFDPEGSVEVNIDTDGSGTDSFDSDYSEGGVDHIFSKSSGGQLFERGQVLQEQRALETGQVLKTGHELGFVNISNRSMAIQFLADRAQKSQIFKEQLVEKVWESRSNDSTDQKLAANAITILVRSGMRFNGADLRYIKVKGANLTGGEFDLADLRDADLTNVIFDKSWLREARLEGARLNGTKFGELPYSLLEDIPTVSAYSPDGSLCAIALDHGSLAVYNTSNWTPASPFERFSDAITSVALSPDGKLLVFGDEFGVLRIWRYTATSIVSVLPGHAVCISDLAFSMDGNYIAAAGQDGKVGVWDTVSGVCIKVLDMDGTRPSCVAFFPDGKQLVSGSSDGSIQLWDLNSESLVTIPNEHDDAISKVLFSPDGRHIASSSSDTTVRIWSASNGIWSQEMVFSGHSKAVTGLVYSSDGQHLVSCGEDSTIRMWDTRSGGPGPIFRGHTDRVVGIAFSQKGDQLTSCGRDKTLRIWDCRAAVKGAVLFGRTNSNSSGMYPYSTIKRYNGNNAQDIRPNTPRPCWGRLFASQSFGTKVTSIGTSPDGLLVVSACTIDGIPAINIWLRVTNEIVHTLTGHSRDISCVAFSPNSQHIASGSVDKTIRIWNTQSGEVINTLKGHDKKVTSIAYSSEGNQIVSGSEDGTIRLWETSTGKDICSFDVDGCEVQCVAFSPAGPWIAAGGEDEAVRIWNVGDNSDEPIFNKNAHKGNVNSIAFSPDGALIVSGGEDGAIKIWNIHSKAVERVLQEDGDTVECLAYSPSGQYIASGGADRNVRIWDPKTGVISESLVHTNSIVGLSYSSDGAQLWTGSDCRIHAWTDAFVVNQAATVSSTDFSKDCKQVAWSLDRTKVQLFNADTGEPELVLSGHSGVIECVSYSPVHNIIASASSDSTVRIWDSETGACLALLKSLTGVVTNVIFSPNGTKIAISCETTLGLWDLDPESLLQAAHSAGGTDNQQASLRAIPILATVPVDHKVEASSTPVYSPDGREISVGDADFTVLRYSTRSGGKSYTPLVGHDGIVTCIAYSLQRDKIVTGSEDNTARIWDRFTGEQLFQLSGHSGGVTSISFSPVDDLVATGDNESTVWIWSYTRIDSRLMLRGHHGPVLCVTFSPDGKFLATGSADRTMRLWNPSNGVFLAKVGDFAAGIRSIRWSKTRDRYRLATGSDENPLGIWELVEEEDENGNNRQNVRRCWGAGVHSLAVSGARIGFGHTLKEADETLLRQRNVIFIAPVTF